MKITARFILVYLLLTTYYLLLTTSPVSAQSQSPYLNPNTNPDVPKNLHTWTQNVMIEVMSAMSCQLTGIDPNPKSKCLGVDPKTGNIGFVPSAGSGQVGGGGAIGVAGKMIAMLYTPPLHTSDYFKYLANNFGIAKPAHAATGFEGLRPIQNLWVAFRDIVYLLFVIIFIVIGLAIMLRVRIDPRTVMTIQNQIPRIIIGILLLTFSFAIAGFLIDLMYVAIFLTYELISRAATPGSLDKLNPLGMAGQSPFDAANELGGTGGIGRIAGKMAKAMFFVVQNLSEEFIDNMLSGGVGKTFLALLGGLAGVLMGTLTGNPFVGLITGLFGIIGGATGITDKLVETVASNILGALAYPIVFLIVAVALLIALFRLWLSLIMAYVGILLNVVFAPFWIAASLLPGSTIGFGAWLRSIISNLAVFPATIVMFLLAKVFIDSFGAKPSDAAFSPPLLGNLPGTNIFGDLIGLGIILMTPNVVAMVKAALKAPSLPAAGIVAGIAAGGRVVGGTTRGISETHIASQEWIQTGVSPTGAPTFGQRSQGRALIGRIFGR